MHLFWAPFFIYRISNNPREYSWSTKDFIKVYITFQYGFNHFRNPPNKDCKIFKISSSITSSGLSSSSVSVSMNLLYSSNLNNSAVQCSAVQCSVVQHGTVRYSTVQYRKKYSQEHSYKLTIQELYFRLFH